MNKLEPTYLRYVYDGLHKGSLNAENASALPQGFIGLFESEFPADISSVERISVLRRLTLWALFKGAVSTHLASEVLEEDEEDTKTLIDTYSKWFNSTEPGKYILYHDRLRSYFLQKLSSHEVQSLNEKLISYLETGLKDGIVDEAQEYALEHLATHMAVESQLDNNYDRLHDFVNQEDLWKRQVRASKEYKWSQQAVQYGIKEGARRHHEMNTLTSTVNSVKLQQEEENSAQQILDLLNEGDYQTALERALSFNGEKLFTIYLLMIHDLTVGMLKEFEFRVPALKLILEEIDKIDDITDQNVDAIIPSNYPEPAIFHYQIILTNLFPGKIILNDEYVDPETGEFIEAGSTIEFTYSFQRLVICKEFKNVIKTEQDYERYKLSIKPLNYFENRTPEDADIIEFADYSQIDYQLIDLSFYTQPLVADWGIDSNQTKFRQIYGYLYIARRYKELNDIEIKSFKNLESGDHINNSIEAAKACLKKSYNLTLDLSLSDTENFASYYDHDYLKQVRYIEEQAKFLILIANEYKDLDEPELCNKLSVEAFELILDIKNDYEFDKESNEYVQSEMGIDFIEASKNRLLTKIFNLFYEMNDLQYCFRSCQLMTVDTSQIQWGSIDRNDNAIKLFRLAVSENNQEIINFVYEIIKDSNLSEDRNAAIHNEIKLRLQIIECEVTIRQGEQEQAILLIENINSITKGLSFAAYSRVKKETFELLSNYELTETFEKIFTYYLKMVINLKEDHNRFRFEQLLDLFYYSHYNKQLKSIYSQEIISKLRKLFLKIYKGRAKKSIKSMFNSCVKKLINLKHITSAIDLIKITDDCDLSLLGALIAEKGFVSDAFLLLKKHKILPEQTHFRYFDRDQLLELLRLSGQYNRLNIYYFYGDNYLDFKSLIMSTIKTQKSSLPTSFEYTEFHLKKNERNLLYLLENHYKIILQKEIYSSSFSDIKDNVFEIFKTPLIQAFNNIMIGPNEQEQRRKLDSFLEITTRLLFYKLDEEGNSTKDSDRILDFIYNLSEEDFKNKRADKENYDAKIHYFDHLSYMFCGCFGYKEHAFEFNRKCFNTKREYHYPTEASIIERKIELYFRYEVSGLDSHIDGHIDDVINLTKELREAYWTKWEESGIYLYLSRKLIESGFVKEGLDIISKDLISLKETPFHATNYSYLEEDKGDLINNIQKYLIEINDKCHIDSEGFNNYDVERQIKLLQSQTNKIISNYTVPEKSYLISQNQKINHKNLAESPVKPKIEFFFSKIDDIESAVEWKDINMYSLFKEELLKGDSSLFNFVYNVNGQYYLDNSKDILYYNALEKSRKFYKKRVVVKDSDLKNHETQISLSDALKIEDDYKIGEKVAAGSYGIPEDGEFAFYDDYMYSSEIRKMIKIDNWNNYQFSSLYLNCHENIFREDYLFFMFRFVYYSQIHLDYIDVIRDAIDIYSFTFDKNNFKFTQ